MNGINPFDEVKKFIKGEPSLLDKTSEELIAENRRQVIDIKVKNNSPRTKEELFIICCKNAEPLITICLSAEMKDLEIRGIQVRKGKFDEYYTRDKEATNKTKIICDEAIEKNSFEDWNNLYKELHPSPQFFKYSKERYQLYESIRQPYFKHEKNLFPQQQEQNREQEQGEFKL